MMRSGQFQMNSAEQQSAQSLIAAALLEDLGCQEDLTSAATIPAESEASVNIVSRESGVLCGIAAAQQTYQQLGGGVRVELLMQDGSRVAAGDIVARVGGPVRVLLTGERTVLNLMCHLSGVASRTAMFVDAVQGCRTVILDTRKTLPAYRLLQKYAVRCGGGQNHRMGLFDGVLIKDNHLAARGDHDPAAAVKAARDYLREQSADVPIEIEVDSLQQLRNVLPALPDIVLLDNMSVAELQEAVGVRDAAAPKTLLEASGGVTLASVRDIAETGVDRISIGGLTHSAPALDLGYDWPT
jgi:nicotinate-nucleotide pyrophosphorylase (carboxylating)